MTLQYSIVKVMEDSVILVDTSKLPIVEPQKNTTSVKQEVVSTPLTEANIKPEQLRSRGWEKIKDKFADAMYRLYGNEKAGKIINAIYPLTINPIVADFSDDGLIALLATAHQLASIIS